MRSQNSVLNEVMDPTGDVDYDTLPEDIKMHVTHKEYRWIGAHGRARLMEDFTTPDWTED